MSEVTSQTTTPRRRRASTKRPTPPVPTLLLGHELIARVLRAADLPPVPEPVREAHLRFIADGRPVYRVRDHDGREALLVTNTTLEAALA